jgi:S-formylglutathione hydrolase
METISTFRSFGGTLSVLDHDSAVTGTAMRFAVYVPPQAENGPVPVLWYLSGLTCNWSNVMEKGNLQAAAARYGVIVVAPDTSPRGEGVPDDESYDLGQGAGFYLTATQPPWSQHFAIDRYITEELPPIIAEHFPADMSRQGIFGHSMGGHGALTLHLKHPETYRTCSAFAPIVAPMQVPWGEKAFTTYLGGDEAAWARHDATALVSQAITDAHILIDQGTPTPSWRSSCARICSAMPARRPVSRSPSTCATATTIPITSSPPSWAITSPTTPRCSKPNR